MLRCAVTWQQRPCRTVPHTQVVSLRKQLAEVQRQLAAKRKLLKVADPDGYFAPGGWTGAYISGIPTMKHSCCMSCLCHAATHRVHVEASSTRWTSRFRCGEGGIAAGGAAGGAG